MTRGDAIDRDDLQEKYTDHVAAALPFPDDVDSARPVEKCG